MTAEPAELFTFRPVVFCVWKSYAFWSAQIVVQTINT